MADALSGRLAERAAPSCAPAAIGLRWWRSAGWSLALILLAGLLLLLTRRADVAPLVEADNAYIFLAADRLYAGDGATSIPPRAPLQPWSWRADWVFLTQWPVGYPALICAARRITGLPTAKAAVALNVVSCAVALLAWFAWARRCLPNGLTAGLLALVAAGAGFSIDQLVNPASDTVLLALLPLVLLLATRVRPVGDVCAADACPCAWFRRVATATGWRLFAAGLLAGALVWVRYAAVFVPAAVGAFLLLECGLRRVRGRDVINFALAAALPIAGLVALNRALGPAVSAQEQFNLGQGVSWQMPAGVVSKAWLNFAQQTPYAHRPEARWLWPLALPAAALAMLAFGGWRARRFASSSPILLSAACVVVLLGMLVAASVLFQGKYNYVGLARYYQPVRSLYFVLFMGVLLAPPWKPWRAALAVPLALVAGWFVDQDARRAYARMQTVDREETPYGRWARHFSPGARDLFAWLETQAGPNLLVFSNFHEEIALETGIPACPTPRDPSELAGWLERIRRSRGVEQLRVLFVLNPDNDYRDYYLPPPAALVETFHLQAATDAPSACRPYVFACAPASDRAADSR